MRRRRKSSQWAGALIGVLVGLLTPAPALGAPGHLDGSFGQGGWTVNGFGPRPEASTANDLLAQPDGKLVAVGGRLSSDSSFIVVRYSQAGAPDPTFGAAGVVVTAIESLSSAQAVALQPDGKLLVAGRSYNCTQSPTNCGFHLALARYNVDGSLDDTFGGGDGMATDPSLSGGEQIALLGGGKFLVGTGDAVARFGPDGSLDQAFATAGVLRDRFAARFVVQADGKLVTAGAVNTSNCNRAFCNFFFESRVARFLPDGSTDTSFGGDGVVSRGGAGSVPVVTAVAIQPGGGILVAGGSSTSAITRYEQDGTQDPSFDAPFLSSIADLAIEGDGKIVTAGGRSTGAFGARLAIARLNLDGSADQSFAGDGVIVDEGLDAANALSLIGGGILIATNTGGAAPGGEFGGDLAIARYDASGGRDLAFGSSGVATSTFLGPSEDVATALALGSAGELVAAGVSAKRCLAGAAITPSCQYDFGVTRYQQDGSLDPSFGDQGRVTTDLGGLALPYDVAVNPEGKVLVAGRVSDNCGGGIGLGGCHYQGVLVRYRADGNLDTGFGASGIVRLPGLGGANGVAVQPDGRIVVVGGTGSNGGASNCYSVCSGEFAVVRLNRDGTLDPSFGNGGVVTTDVGGDGSAAGDEATEPVLLPDGKIVVAGGTVSCATPGCGLGRFVIARYNPEGTLDHDFGSDGVSVADTAPALALAIDARTGDLVGLGGGLGGAGTAYSIVRFKADGRRDRKFWADGVLESSAGMFGRDLGIDPQGRIVVAGGMRAPQNASDCLTHPGLLALGCVPFVARYNPDGSSDDTFADHGFAAVDFSQTGANNAAAVGLAISPDGSLTIAGVAQTALDGDQFALARLEGGGPPLRRCNGKYATVVGSSGSDHLRGTPDRDIVAALAGNDVVRGFGGADLVCGGPGSDRLIGGPGKDHLFGGPGSDRLFGGSGDDRLLGGNGNDVLRGGAGDDVLRGGAGLDNVGGRPGRH